MSKQKKPHLSDLGLENKNTNFLSPTVPEEVEDLISSMKTNKGSGPNSIPTNILQERNFKTLKWYEKYVFQ